MLLEVLNFLLAIGCVFKKIMKSVEYRGLDSVEGSVLIAKRRENSFFGEVVYVKDRFGSSQVGRIIDLSDEACVVQVFGSTSGLSLKEATVEFLQEPMQMRVSPEMIGRVFDGLARPIDGFPPLYSARMRSINGYPINPYARVYPRDFIQTGISAIDGMNTLIRGQKLPIFSGNGMPHNRLTSQIIRQAKIKNSDEDFVIVFAGMGIKYDTSRYFIDSFEKAGVSSHVVMFLSLADSPSVERIITPRCALTAAEYLAYECDKHVLVILTDMTNYCEALREVSALRSEVPGRKGYPGYLYSDLAELYERAGKIATSKGSITQLPILSMPNDDISHPIPDLTGYITEGQIVLDRDMSQKDAYPPISPLPSLSRLMKDGIGEGMTRDDHKDVASQLFAAYSRVKNIRNMASIVGEEEMNELDKKYLRFGTLFERFFLSQNENENRSIEETLDIGWATLSVLPKSELYRISESLILKYMQEARSRVCKELRAELGEE